MRVPSGDSHRAARQWGFLSFFTVRYSAVVSELKFASAWFLLLIMAVSAVGCGDSVELVYVEGTVTLDSQPIPDAEVIFRPEDGRPSAATTDSKGHYVLHYLPDRAGALPGTHRVVISTYIEADPDSPNPVIQEGRAEAIPECYNTSTTLTAELKPGQSDTLDFALRSTQVTGL
jgi:hypothetical protein